jgi:hypothetical protein
MKEMDQLHRGSCFTPASIKKMTQAERRKAQVALMFLGEKRDALFLFIMFPFSFLSVFFILFFFNNILLS